MIENFVRIGFELQSGGYGTVVGCQFVRNHARADTDRGICAISGYIVDGLIRVVSRIGFALRGGDYPEVIAQQPMGGTARLGVEIAGQDEGLVEPSGGGLNNLYRRQLILGGEGEVCAAEVVAGIFNKQKHSGLLAARQRNPAHGEGAFATQNPHAIASPLEVDGSSKDRAHEQIVGNLLENIAVATPLGGTIDLLQGNYIGSAIADQGGNTLRHEPTIRAYGMPDVVRQDFNAVVIGSRCLGVTMQHAAGKQNGTEQLVKFHGYVSRFGLVNELLIWLDKIIKYSNMP